MKQETPIGPTASLNSETDRSAKLAEARTGGQEATAVGLQSKRREFISGKSVKE